MGHSVPSQTVDYAVKHLLPGGTIATLLGSIEGAIERGGDKEGSFIHITSAYKKEDSDLIAFESAVFAATQENKKVLFLDCAREDRSILVKKGLTADISIDQFMQQRQAGQSQSIAAITNIHGTSFSCAQLRSVDDRGQLSLNVQSVKTLFESLRTQYDLIVIHSDNALSSGIAATLAPLTDGSVLVISAERTRTPVVKELRQVIESSGGTVLGSVMSGRKYYIPRWIYKLFFHADNRD